MCTSHPHRREAYRPLQQRLRFDGSMHGQIDSQIDVKSPGRVRAEGCKDLHVADARIYGCG